MRSPFPLAVGDLGTRLVTNITPEIGNLISRFQIAPDIGNLIQVTNIAPDIGMCNQMVTSEITE